MPDKKIHPAPKRSEVLASGHVVPEPLRCVQCGICTFNCPVGIDVRRHVWLGKHVIDSYCITCGDQIETQGKPLSKITISFTQDTKHL